jgi:hypothetical protein
MLSRERNQGSSKTEAGVRPGEQLTLESACRRFRAEKARPEVLIQ